MRILLCDYTTANHVPTPVPSYNKHEGATHLVAPSCLLFPLLAVSARYAQVDCSAGLKNNRGWRGHYSNHDLLARRAAEHHTGRLRERQKPTYLALIATIGAL